MDSSFVSTTPATRSSFTSMLLTSAFVRISAPATVAGAEIRTNAEVKSIEVKEDRVAGVVLTNDESIPAWTVVSNGDPGVTFTKLLDYAAVTPSLDRKSVV